MTNPDSAADEVAVAADALTAEFAQIAERVRDLVEATYTRGFREGLEVAAEIADQTAGTLRTVATTTIETDFAIAALEMLRDHYRLAALTAGEDKHG